MQAFPHNYNVTIRGETSGLLQVSAKGLPDLIAAAPLEFDGPGDQWSPETLLLSSASACFVLSFRAVAQASKFEWSAINCRTEGKLDRIDRVTRFTHLTHHVNLTVKPGVDADKARKLLSKTESVCLVSNSMNVVLQTEVEIEFE